AVERLLEADLQLGLDRRLAGGRPLADELSGQSRRGRRGHRAAVERDLAARVAGPHPQVVAMHQRHLLTRPEAEPEEEGHRGVAEIIADLPADVQIDLLDHIGGVDSALQAAVEPESDHAAQPAAIAPEEILQPLRMPLTGSPEGLE